VHPGDAQDAAIVAWASPITGRVRVTGKLSMAESPNCGNGVAWWIYKNNSVLNSGTIVVGQTANLATNVLGLTTSDSVYLVVDSIGGDFWCDMTVTTMKIHG
jgi:hypothetical protein